MKRLVFLREPPYDYMIWTINNTVVEGRIASECKPNVAMFDFDGTLVRTASGNVHPKSYDDWVLAFPVDVMRAKLSALSDTHSIVIISNQKNLKDPPKWQSKVDAVIAELGPLVVDRVYAAMGDDKYRKPRTGMCPHAGPNSFFVGDAAGRDVANGRKRKDFSCSDRKFAANCGIEFHTPEEYFMDAPIEPFNWGYVYTPSNVPVYAPSIPEVIVLCGYPGSGKSTYASSLGYSIFSFDTGHKSVLRFDPCAGLVIDNTNPTAKSRAPFIAHAKEHGMRVVCVKINTSIEQSFHNCTYRKITGGRSLSDVVLYTFRSRYEEPTMDEGFDAIVESGVPGVATPLYMSHL